VIMKGLGFQKGPYKIGKDSVYTTLTENEILETRTNDPFWTSRGDYISHTGHEE
jgi:hypothetical protein